jgi:hypothetical protein
MNILAAPSMIDAYEEIQNLHEDRQSDVIRKHLKHLRKLREAVIKKNRGFNDTTSIKIQSDYLLAIGVSQVSIDKVLNGDHKKEVEEYFKNKPKGRPRTIMVTNGEKHPISTYFTFFENLPEHQQRKRKLWWYQMLKEGRNTCPITFLEVAYFQLDQLTKNGRVLSSHWNFYSEDGQMFTVDHINPKIKGGSNDVANLQPMIAQYNHKKSDLTEFTNEEIKNLVINA